MVVQYSPDTLEKERLYMTNYEQPALIESNGVTFASGQLPPEQTALFPRQAGPRDLATLSPDDLRSMAADEQFSVEGVDFTSREKQPLVELLDPIADIDPGMASELAQECLRIKRNGGSITDMLKFIEDTLSSDTATAA